MAVVRITLDPYSTDTGSDYRSDIDPRRNVLSLIDEISHAMGEAL